MNPINAQLDYIYFFYGLSFIILAIVCFGLYKLKTSILPFFWLGMFGLAHGINEWLDLTAVDLFDKAVFSDIRLAVLFVSFMFLFEFGRRGVSILYDCRLSRWIYIPIFLAVLSGRGISIDVCNAYTRYLLGFPAGLLSFLVFYKFSFSAQRGRGQLILLGILSVVYTCIMIIVPKMDFFPASLLNCGSFLNVMRFPVQLLRGICAMLAAGAIWIYFNKIYLRSIDTVRLRSVRFKMGGWLLVVFITILTAGWFFTNYLGNIGKQDIVSNSDAVSRIISSYLESELLKIDQIAKNLSGSPFISGPIMDYNQETAKRAEEALDRYDMEFDLSVAYVLNGGGVTVVSSNRNDPDSFVGKSYVFRPYFRDAISGGYGSYLGLGVTSAKRGYYASAPIRGAKKEIIGVVAVKKDIATIEDVFRKYDNFFVIDNNGIVFISNNDKYLLKSLWPLSSHAQAAIIETRQYGKGPFPAIFWGHFAPGGEIELDGRRYYVHMTPFRYDWSIVLLSPNARAVYYRLMGIGITLVFAVFVCIFSFWLAQRENLLDSAHLSGAKLQLIFDSATQVSIIATDSMGIITRFNKGAEKMLGYSSGELVGKKSPEVFHSKTEMDDRRREMSAALGRNISGFDVFVEYARIGEADVREWTYVRKDGSHVPVSLAVTAIKSKDGGILGFLGVGIDISRSRHSEEELNKRLEELEHLNRIMIDRERRVIELKEEIAALRAKLSE